LAEYALTSAVELLIEDSLDEYITTANAELLVEDSLDEYSRTVAMRGMLNWAYDNVNTSNTDPTAGKIKFNNATITTATTAYIDDETFSAMRADSVLNRLRTGDMLWFQEQNNPAKFVFFAVTGTPTDQSGWWSVPIDTIWAGATTIADEDTLICQVFVFDDAGSGGSGDDTGAYIDADGGSALERPYMDIFNAGGLADTFALLTDSTQALIWTDSTLGLRGKQGTVTGDTTSTAALRTVINNTRAMYQTEDSTRIDSALTANRLSTDSLQLGEGWMAQADGAGLVITSGVLDVVGDSTITVSAGSMTVANVPDGSVDSNKAVNGSLASSDIHAMVSDSLGRILSDESGTGLFVRTIDPDFGTVLDIDSVGIDTLVVSTVLKLPAEYLYLTDVHGFGRALEDEIYLQANIQTPNGDTTYLLRDSAGNITAGDDDTVNVSGYIPFAALIDSLTVFYRISSGSEITDSWLMGPDKSTFTNLTDSIWQGPNTTDLTSTTWATTHYDIAQDVALAGYRYTFKYLVNFDTDNDRLQIGWIRLKIRRQG
jgi:hypothetical protein